VNLASVSVAALYLFSFLSALCILIFVHEVGHFLVARKLGVGVTKFSFGFGPKLFGIKRGETEYLVSAIPFGGYVKLVGESDSDDVKPADEAKSFSRKPVWVKMAVVAAGPVGNLVFAVAAFWTVFLGGVPALTTRISVAPDSPAARAGLRNGDVVVRIDGTAVETWEDLASRIKQAGGNRTLAVTARRGSGEVSAAVTAESLETRNEFGEKVREPGIGVSPALTTKIGDVQSGSPAERGGLRRDDVILRVGSDPVETWEELAARIRKGKAGQPLDVAVRRGTKEISLAVTPELREVTGPEGGKVKEPKIGIIGSQETVIRRLGPAGALVRATEETWRFISLTAMTVVKLVTRVVPAKTLGGPLLIAQIAGDQARQGATQFGYFLGLLSVNLGILNLLPIPILDGGHLLFFAIEGLRRKPLSPQARAIAQQVGLAIILMITAMVFYNDIARLILPGRTP
jgi:regulator of sigma E protease